MANDRAWIQMQVIWLQSLPFLFFVCLYFFNTIIICCFICFVIFNDIQKIDTSSSSFYDEKSLFSLHQNCFPIPYFFYITLLIVRNIFSEDAGSSEGIKRQKTGPIKLPSVRTKGFKEATSKVSMLKQTKKQSK